MKKLDELHIIMRNCKMSRKMEGQSVDYAVICAKKRDPSQYSQGACTPPKKDGGPPCDEAATIVVEFPPIDNLQERHNFVIEIYMLEYYL
jgi:hypothetical protein